MEADPGNQKETAVESAKVGVTSPVEKRPPSPAFHDSVGTNGSMVTIRLSEPPNLSVKTDLPPSPLLSRRSLFGPMYTPTSAVQSPLKAEIMREDEPEPVATTEVANAETTDPAAAKNLEEELHDSTTEDEPKEAVTQSAPEDSMEEDEEDEEPNWEELQKTENEHAQDQDENSTAMLLARLEEENNKLAANPKGVRVKAVERIQQESAPRQPRPPSMAQLRDMVTGPLKGPLRYSVLPPPPMTDLEFYAALVRDYQQTAARLPTLLSRKIRSGIPPPLRGVVWQSMAGARDSMLLEQFERLSGESSPYEGLIGKDLGRSFPGVEMFRDPDGEGQRMLGRVLKCFSLYDQKIGYCQGLAFLVGPLLMHMAESQAFCVLVRLMEHYDLRSCFLPDLSGLHVRIYQFRELLRLSQPQVSAHLEELQVDPAYVSQWFLSFFAVTCPLPMLFRIYDVVFAEGASETIMRVALSLMRKNESRILACAEMEDVMQLLLSRGLWDCYHYNADEFVDDFVGLSNVVSREKLALLEQNYRESQVVIVNERRSDVATAATRFLGRLWAATSTPKSAAVSPGLTPPSRPLSMLRRSTSGQSIASTLNSMEASSASVASTTSTEATTVSRDSSNADGCSVRESTPTAAKHGGGHNISMAESRTLHSQIEDLLTAISEMQREHANLANELQKEREDREEERNAFKTLLNELKKQKTAADATTGSMDAQTGGHSADDLSHLIEGVEERLGSEIPTDSNGAADGPETKSQLRDELARTKDNLINEVSKCQDLNNRIDELSQEAQSLRDQLRESHAHVRNLHQEKQRLEKQASAMRLRASSSAAQHSEPEGGGWFSSSTGNSNGNGNNGGLRELKLGRSKSTPNAQSRYNSGRSSLNRSQTEPPPSSPPETEALIQELAQAKTAEAIARQEADEYRQKFEHLKRQRAASAGETPNGAASVAMGMLGRLTTVVSEASGGSKNTTPSPPSATAPAAASATHSGGGFWGWRR